VRGNADDPGLITPEETSLLTDQYELAMAASYFKRGMNAPSVFELFARHLPEHRQWLLVAGIGPALSMVESMRFGDRELEYLASLGRPAGVSHKQVVGELDRQAIVVDDILG
jgi:nicotinic acid phosphoribosyltransferase